MRALFVCRITVKAKTTDKRTREVKKKKIQFLASTSGKTIGACVCTRVRCCVCVL